MRNKTLVRLLDEVRAEARLSQNPAHNNQVRDPHIILLQREQERLWRDYNWPHLRVERYIPAGLGQRYYSPPPDLSVDRIEAIQFKWSGEWMTLNTGITSAHYAIQDSDLGFRSSPAVAWRVSEDYQIELWPIPDSGGVAATRDAWMKVIGVRDLRPLVDDNDRADLDDQMLVLYVAGGLLAAQGAKDAQLKIEAANKIYAKLKSGQSKGARFSLYGGGGSVTRSGPIMDRYIPATGGSTSTQEPTTPEPATFPSDVLVLE